MLEKIIGILNGVENINVLDQFLTDRQKIVFRYFIYIIKKENIDINDVEKLTNFFIIDIKKGNVISRYINGEDIDTAVLNRGIEMLIKQIIMDNFSETENYSKIIKN